MLETFIPMISDGTAVLMLETAIPLSEDIQPMMLETVISL